MRNSLDLIQTNNNFNDSASYTELGSELVLDNNVEVLFLIAQFLFIEVTALIYKELSIFLLFWVNYFCC